MLRELEEAKAGMAQAEAELAKYAASDPKHLEKARLWATTVSRDSLLPRFTPASSDGKKRRAALTAATGARVRVRPALAQVLATAKAAHDACNRWTDNVFLLRQYLEKQFGRGDSVEGLFKAQGAPLAESPTDAIPTGVGVA